MRPVGAGWLPPQHLEPKAAASVLCPASSAAVGVAKRSQHPADASTGFSGVAAAPQQEVGPAWGKQVQVAAGTHCPQRRAMAARL